MSLLVLSCCVMKYSETQWLRTISSYYLTVSPTQEFRNILYGWSASGCLMKLLSRCQLWLPSSKGLAGLQNLLPRKTVCACATGYGQDASGPLPRDLSASFLSAFMTSLLTSPQNDPSKTARQRSQCLLWPSLGSHTPSFSQYPISYRGQLYSLSEGTTHRREHQEESLGDP